MKWIPLTNDLQLEELRIRSNEVPQLIFKHSTRCSISSMVKNRLDKEPDTSEVECYYLDLLQYRSVSNAIASIFEVEHQSPQLLLIKNGVCLYHESQHAIYFDEVLSNL